MRRVLTFMALASVLALVGQLAPPLARVGHACLCNDDPSVARALREADAVFTGRVYAVQGGLDRASTFLDWLSVLFTGQPAPMSIEPTHARLAVIEVWKGALGSDVEIWTGIGGGVCEYFLKPQEEHLIYASLGRNGDLWTSICTRSMPLSQSPGDLATLGPGTRPVPDRPLWWVAVESPLRAMLATTPLLTVLLGLLAAGILTLASIGAFRVVRRALRRPQE